MSGRTWSKFKVRTHTCTCTFTSLLSALRCTVYIVITIRLVLTLTITFIEVLSQSCVHPSSSNELSITLFLHTTLHYTPLHSSTLHHTVLPHTPPHPSTPHLTPYTTHHCAGKCETIGPDPEEQGGIGYLDGDTTLSQGSFSAAMHAAGSVCEAVDMVIKKKVIEW